MFYIVGLGNPGEKYAHTRHNIGWRVVDALVETNGLPSPVSSSKYAGRISEGVLAGSEVSVLYPATFMNKSGRAVKKLVPNGAVGNLIVVYDDIDVPVGEIKVSVGRGSGGHNGIESVIVALGSKAFIRVRVGVAPRGFFGVGAGRPKGEKLPKHVLSDFTKRESGAVAEGVEKAVQAIEHIVSKGVESAMNACN